MSDKRKDPSRVTLKRVRLSFADIWQAKAFGDGDGEPKFSANFLIDPDGKYGAANLDAMEDAIEHVISQQKEPRPFEKLKDEKRCLRNGDDYDYDGYEGMMFVSASNAKRPVILDRDKTALTEADGVVYSGCIVDAIVRVWGQDNKWGKRLNASLEGIRFVEDGEPFGAAPLDPDEFEDLDEDDERPSRRRGRDDDDDRSSRGSRRSRDDDEDEKPSRRRSRDDDDEDEKPSRRRSRDEDDEDEKPSRRRSRDDDDERPSRRRARDDEDDDEDRPSRNSRARRSRDEDDEDEKPARRRSRDEGDEDDRPRRRNREAV